MGQRLGKGGHVVVVPDAGSVEDWVTTGGGGVDGNVVRMGCVVVRMSCVDVSNGWVDVVVRMGRWDDGLNVVVRSGSVVPNVVVRMGGMVDIMVVVVRIVGRFEKVDGSRVVVRTGGKSQEVEGISVVVRTGGLIRKVEIGRLSVVVKLRSFSVVVKFWEFERVEVMRVVVRGGSFFSVVVRFWDSNWVTVEISMVVVNFGGLSEDIVVKFWGSIEGISEESMGISEGSMGISEGSMVISVVEGKTVSVVITAAAVEWN
jgi:hypothetical protein